MSYFSSTQKEFQAMFNTLQSRSSGFHSQQGIREQQRLSMFIAGRKVSNCDTLPDIRLRWCLLTLPGKLQDKQFWFREQSCRKVKSGINSSRVCCSVYLGTEGDPSTGNEGACGVQSLAPEKSWVGDWTSFWALLNRTKANWGIESDQGPSRNTSQGLEWETGPETGLEKRFPSTLAWGHSGDRTRNYCIYRIAQGRSRCTG